MYTVWEKTVFLGEDDNCNRCFSFLNVQCGSCETRLIGNTIGIISDSIGLI